MFDEIFWDEGAVEWRYITNSRVSGPSNEKALRVPAKMEAALGVLDKRCVYEADVVSGWLMEIGQIIAGQDDEGTHF